MSIVYSYENMEKLYLNLRSTLTYIQYNTDLDLSMIMWKKKFPTPKKTLYLSWK